MLPRHFDLISLECIFRANSEVRIALQLDRFAQGSKKIMKILYIYIYILHSNFQPGIESGLPKNRKISQLLLPPANSLAPTCQLPGRSKNVDEFI